jgi:hypothetical protein
VVDTNLDSGRQHPNLRMETSKNLQFCTKKFLISIAFYHEKVVLKFSDESMTKMTEKSEKILLKPKLLYGSL